MRFIVFIVTFLLQSQSQPIQETIESETEIVWPDTSSEVNSSNDDENISRNDDDSNSIFETSEKDDNGDPYALYLRKLDMPGKVRCIWCGT